MWRQGSQERFIVFTTLGDFFVYIINQSDMFIVILSCALFKARTFL